MMSPEPVKFLLVDDIEENLRALEALLRRDGLTLYKARSGVEALEMLLEHDFALALLDVQMPDMDGFELAEMMRGTERTRRVPIIFVTAASTDEGRRFKGYEAGAVDFIYKPIDPLILKSKAEVFFSIARQHEQLARQKDALATAAAELKGALDRLQAHTDNSPLAIVEFDPDMRLLGWSKGAERLFGWTAAEMTGQSLADLGWLCDSSIGELARWSPARWRTRRTSAAITRCAAARARGRGAGLRMVQLRAAPAQRTAGLAQRADPRHHRPPPRRGNPDPAHRRAEPPGEEHARQRAGHRHPDAALHTQPRQFSATFSGRIQALARAHGMLSDRTWQGADLMDLVHDQLRLGTVDPARLQPVARACSCCRSRRCASR